MEERTGTTKRRTRREILAGAAGALGVMAAEALAKAPAAEATQGQAVIAGQSNTATQTTTVDASGGSGVGLVAQGGGVFPGVKGFGGSGGGIGVYGEGGSGERGLVGFGGSGNAEGVEGQGSGTASGVKGTGGSSNGAGVWGFGGSGNAAGVNGWGTGTGIGVSGLGGANDGPGVVGTGGGNNANGVEGYGFGGGIGVKGSTQSSIGIGVYAVGPESSGYGLFIDGRIGFGTRAGIATIPKGQARVTITGVTLTPFSSFVLATLQQNTGRYVKSAVPDPANSRVVIYVNKAVLADTPVAFLIVN